MKNKRYLILSLLLFIPLFITVAFAIWYVSDFKTAKPDLENVLTKYIDNQETTYDGNFQLPSPKVFENTIPLNPKDLSYSFKLKDTQEDYIICEENKLAPKNAGIYLIKVVYDLSYTDINGNKINNTCEKEITFTINQLDISKSELITINFIDHPKDEFFFIDNETVIPEDLEIKFNDTVLEENNDYQVIYENNNQIGTANAKITGKGNFTGTINKQFNIVEDNRFIYLRDDFAAENGIPQEVIYNGDIQYPVITAYADKDYTQKLDNVIFTYNLEPKDANGYYITITASKEGYPKTSTISVSFIINPKPIQSFTWENTQFTYDGSKHFPTATPVGLVNDDKCLVKIDEKTKQINAGSYVAEIATTDVLSNSNYCLDKNLENKNCSYTILRAQIQGLYTGESIALNTKAPYTEGDDVSITKTSNYKLLGVNNELITDGSIVEITYQDAKFIDGTNKKTMTSKVTANITFTTSNTNYYDFSYTYEQNVTIYAVATIGSMYYGTVKRAIDAAVSNNEIFLIPGINPTLRENAEIKSGVTFNIVYEENHFIDNRKSSLGGFAESNPATYLKNTLTIAELITLTNRGTINIDGVVGDGIENSSYAGQTSGNYTQIMMEKGSKIDNYSSIYCLGYIKEKEKGTTTINVNQGTISAPFVVYDYKGGTITTTLNNQNICPFKIYDLPNVQVPTTIKYGARYQGLVGFHFDSINYYINEKVYIIGINSDSNSLFKLSNGSLKIEYEPSYNSNNTINYTNSTMQFNINGDCETGSISVSGGIPIIAQIEINTKNYYCPISHKLKIYQDSGTMNITNKFEFMPGSVLFISKNAAVNINAETVFYRTYSDDSQSWYAYKYYVDNKEAAKLVVNGNCYIKSGFAGIIDTTDKNGVLQITSNQCINFKDGNANSSNLFYGTSDGITLDGSSTAVLPALGYISSTNGGYTQFANSQLYASNGTCWEPTQNTGSYTVTYHYKNELNETKEETITYNIFENIEPKLSPISVQDPAYYTHNDDDWFIESDYKTRYNEFTGQITNGVEYNLYLKQTEKKYSINYIDFHGNTAFGSESEKTYKEYENINILSPTSDSGEKFLGWSLSMDRLELGQYDINPGINAQKVIEYLEQYGMNSINLYGKFAEQFTVKFNTGYADITINEQFVESGKTLINLNALTTPLQNKLSVPEFAQYFVHWETEDGKIFDMDTIVTENITLNAVWENKEITLTIDYVNGTEKVIYYYRTGTEITPIALPANKAADSNAPYGYRCDEFTLTGIKEENGKWTFTSNNPTVTAQWKRLYKVTVESDRSSFNTGGGSITKFAINSEELMEYNEITIYVCEGDILTFVVKYNGNNSQKTTVTNATIVAGNGSESDPFKYKIGSADVTITIKSRFLWQK